MKAIEEILTAASQLAVQQQLPYAGALRPQEAFEVLQSVPNATLVDVRTRAELDWVGRVPGSRQIEWNTYPNGAQNPEFAAQLQTEIADKDTPVLFLCRSGGRSHAAAKLAAQLGYRRAYNVLEGFEGDKDAQRHRGNLNGWRFHGLPWEQS